MQYHQLAALHHKPQSWSVQRPMIRATKLKLNVIKERHGTRVPELSVHLRLKLAEHQRLLFGNVFIEPYFVSKFL
jgi:hypothetical protein